MDNDKLLIKNKNGYERLKENEISQVMNFSEGYKLFLNQAKTERESVNYIVLKAQKSGFTKFEIGKKYKKGDKIYFVNRNRAVIMATIGDESLDKGVTMLISHIDSPRIDLTPRPLYESSEMAFLKTQYYGGIKKYQWTALPLSVHGIVVKKDGTIVNIVLGENDDEPVFCITELLPHLAEDQMKRSSFQIVKGDELNILVGSKPLKDDKESQKVKLNIMKLLNLKYGIIESDLISADLSFVPAIKAKDVGFDLSMIGSYGHDDRVCAYAALEAHLESEIPNKTIITVFTDKEEVGSDGNTGLKSKFMEYFIADLAKPYGLDARTVLSNSVCLSADVTSAFDPTWQEPYDKYNSAYVNYGVSLTKYTGGRGKSGTSEASAEFMAEVINLLDKNGVIWQTGNLGKVDIGGGGTIAKYVANLDVDVIDIGVPVLSMHAPYEVVSKIDLYMTNRAFYYFINR